MSEDTKQLTEYIDPEEEREDRDLNEEEYAEILSYSQEQENKKKIAAEHADFLESQRQLTKDFQDLFVSIFLEFYDVESGLDRAKEEFTEALLKQGVEANFHQVYSYVDNITVRMSKISAVKRLLYMMGLHREFDSIMQKEIDLIYSTREKTIIPSGKIVGENND